MLSRWSLPVDNFEKDADQLERMKRELDELLRDVERELGEPKAFQFRWQFQRKNPHQTQHLVRRMRVYLNSAPQKLAKVSHIDKL